MIGIRVLRDGACVREAVFSSLPVTIGRSPASDLILLDDSVSRTHARLQADENGGLRLHDLGSRNGVHVGPARIENVAVDGLLRCRVGVVELEIEPLGEADTREIKLGDWNRFERRRTVGDQARYLLTGVLGWLAGIAIAPGFWSPWNKSRGVQLLGSGIGMLIALPLAAAVLLVALKAFGRQLRVADTLGSLAALTWIWPAYQALCFLAYYPLAAAAFGAFKTGLFTVASVVAVIVLAGVRRRPPSTRFRTVWAVVTLVLVGGLLSTIGLAARRNGEPALDFHVQVPLFGWAGRASDMDAYMARVRATAAEAADAAEVVRVRQEPD
jgi:FHA domain